MFFFMSYMLLLLRSKGLGKIACTITRPRMRMEKSRYIATPSPLKESTPFPSAKPQKRVIMWKLHAFLKPSALIEVGYRNIQIQRYIFKSNIKGFLNKSFCCTQIQIFKKIKFMHPCALGLIWNGFAKYSNNNFVKFFTI